MARYAQLENTIWIDLEGYSPLSKLLYVYSFSNVAVRDSGLYLIRTKTIYDDTGLNEEQFIQCLTELGAARHPKLAYDFENKVMYVAGLLSRRMSGLKENGNMLKAIKHDLLEFRYSSVTPLFIEKYEGALDGLLKGLLKGLSPSKGGSLPLTLPLPLPEKEKGVGKEKTNNPFGFTDSEIMDIMREIAKAHGWMILAEATQNAFWELITRMREQRQIENPFAYALASAKENAKPAPQKVSISRPEE